MEPPEPSLRLLHAIHDFLPRHVAGSEIYADTLCRELAARHHVTVVCAEYDPSRRHGQLAWRRHQNLTVIEIANNGVASTFADTYRSPVITARLEQILRIVQPHVLHVHNLLNLSFDLPAAARRLGIPVVATLHDYTLVCPSGGQRIHRADAHVCHTIEPERCVRCFRESPHHVQAAVAPVAAAAAASRPLQRMLAAIRERAPSLATAAAQAFGRVRQFPVTPAEIEERLSRVREVFEHIDLFVAPSRSIAGELIALGLAASKVRVSDYGLPPMPQVTRAPARVPLRIGFVGTLTWHKGVHVLIEAARRLPRHGYRLHIHGDLAVRPDYAADLRRQAAGLPVTFHGGFDRSEAPGVYGGLDVLVVPSIWLENSPLVVHEAFQAGVPVVAARIGGLTGLVADGHNGRLYDPCSPAELAGILRALIDRPATLDEWAGRLPPVKSIADEAREWESVYRALVRDVRAPEGAAV